MNVICFKLPEYLWFYYDIDIYKNQQKNHGMRVGGKCVCNTTSTFFFIKLL